MSLTGAFTTSDVIVNSATIDNQDGRVVDIFRVTTMDGQKVGASGRGRLQAAGLVTAPCAWRRAGVMAERAGTVADYTKRSALVAVGQPCHGGAPSFADPFSDVPLRDPALSLCGT